ncbi:hypothetical protein ERJ75_001285900 [Trypanosoma vivax]|nr:hypothetical protein ERJ75_001285900 [Trypanosoma vivax]
MARARDNYRHETETSSAMQAAVQPEQEPVRTLPRAMREVVLGRVARTTHNGPVDAGACGTKRYLHKKEGGVAGGVPAAFLGYGASSQASDAADSCHHGLVRTHLAMGRGEAQRRRDAVAARRRGQRAHATEFRRTRERRTRECRTRMRRHAAPPRGWDALHAERGGRAARMLTRDGEDLVRSSAAEVVREVDGLYPQEDVSTFPQPPLPVTVVGVEKEGVACDPAAPDARRGAA